MLQATAAQIAGLTIATLLPGFLIGLIAGVGIDRWRRRGVMILADLGRAVTLAAVPFLAFTGHLTLVALYAIAVVASVLTVFFDVAEQSYIPSIVASQQLVEANSRLAATASVGEITAFGIAGWLVQWFTAPVAIAIDAVTFLGSAALLATIRSPEPTAETPARVSAGIWQEMLYGVRTLLSNRSLRAITISVVASEGAYGIIGTVYALYALRDLGFQPGVLGLVFAIGGVSSLAASVYASRINRRLGIGPTVVFGLSLAAIGTLLMPLARGAGVVALLLLVAQQLVGDGGATISEINQTTLRQALTPPGLLGRVNGGSRFAALGATLFGTLLGGVLGQTAGYRLTLIVGALAMFGGGLVVLGSPVARVRHATG